MLMGARSISRKLPHLSHQDSRSASNGSHLAANKVSSSWERSRGIVESDRMRRSTIGRWTEDKARRKVQFLHLEFRECSCSERTWRRVQAVGHLILNCSTGCLEDT
ncbi:hypothetical protein ElyMa_006994200 [Elysia marginata]|uniref:Uncharacterized protein n=1 Tax=Elysia marginata TaxID=1093978 RepID=A0AAV4JMT2_9GAST|nr:hypothetical protein ElyMa_006994200 [Elysia marginata]